MNYPVGWRQLFRRQRYDENDPEPPLPGDNREADHKPRRIAALDEICAIFQQPDDDPVSLMMMAHRLRSVHAQFDDDTSLPFPLHELRLLGEAVTM